MPFLVLGKDTFVRTIGSPEKYQKGYVLLNFLDALNDSKRLPSGDILSGHQTSETKVAFHGETFLVPRR